MNKVSIFCASMLVVCACSESGPPPNELNSAGPTSVEAQSVEEPVEAVEAVPPAPTSKWTYDERTDEMRGTSTKLAHLESENLVGVDWPYTPGPARMVLRNRPTDGLSVLIHIDGQFTCSSYSTTQVAVKFDDGEIESFGCSEPEGGVSGTLFIESESRFVGKLKAAERLVIELPVYNAGPQQMTFNVAGLVWE